MSNLLTRFMRHRAFARAQREAIEQALTESPSIYEVEEPKWLLEYES